MYYRAVKNVFRRKTRSVLVIVVLSFVLAMLVSIPPSITQSQNDTQKNIDTLLSISQEVNATISMVATQIDCHIPVVVTPNSDKNNETTHIQPLMNMTQYINNISSISHVKDVIPTFDVEENSTGFVYNIYALPLDNASLLSMYPLLLPSNITVGRNLEFGDGGVVVLQERVADYFGMDVGDSFRLWNETFLVVGIEGYSVLNSTTVYMDLEDVWGLTNNTGNVTNLRVFADDISNVEKVASEVCLMFPELSVSFSASLVYSFLHTQSQLGQQLELMQENLSYIQSVGMLEMGVVVVVAGMIVLFIMMYTVRERTKEIGILKALGASNWGVLGQFMFEGVLLSLFAGVFGVLIGTVGVFFFVNLLLPAPVVMVGDGGVSSLGAGSSVAITSELVLFGLGMAVLLGALGSLYPAWRAARIRPAEAMRYE